MTANLRDTRTCLLTEHFSQHQVRESAKAPATDVWRKEMWGMYRVEYYSATKKEITSFSGRYMEPEITVLSDISQTQKDKYCMCFF